MSEYVERIRVLLPAEVTGAFVALQQVYGGNLTAEYLQEMKVVFVCLLITNIIIFLFVRKIRNLIVLVIVSLGFALWCAMLDPLRARDWIGDEYYSYMPIALVVYTLFLPVINLKVEKS